MAGVNYPWPPETIKIWVVLFSEYQGCILMAKDRMNEVGCEKQSTVFGILKSALENTREAFVTIDENHKVIFFNKAAEKLFGYSREEVLGKELDVLLTPSCREGHRAAVANYLKTRKAKLIGHETEMLLTDRNGNDIPTSISFSVAELKGKFYFTAIIRDITEITTCQAQVVESERLAALGQVVAEIVHEIKNPLMLVGGFALQLEKTLQDEKSLKKISIIVQEVERMENLLDELKDLYLPRDLNVDHFEVNDLLREIYSLTNDNCEKKDIQLSLDISPEKLLVEGDREKLKQVFLNLIKNASEAVSSGGQVSIQSRQLKDTAEITISDDGIGIPDKYQSMVFTPFFTMKKFGTGLGLSVSKRIIDEHKGCSIGLESREGKGTSFKITMPLHTDAKVQLEPE